MKNLLALSLLMVAFVNASYSYDPNSWSLVYAPYGRNIMDVEVLDFNTIIVVGGNQENDAITSIFKSTDRGQSWDIIRDIPQAPWLLAVDFVDTQTGYAVGESGLVLKTTDGGDNWVELTLPGNSASRNYNDVVFSDANNGIIVGGSESNDAITTILKTTDGGNSWSIISDNLGSWVKAVQFPSSSVGYASGDGIIWKTNDGGETWSPLTLTGNAANRTFNDLHFLTDQIGIAVGGNRDNDSIQTIVRTEDGGATWSVLSDGLGSWLNAIDFSNSTKGIVVGDDGVLRFTEDQGATWQALQLSSSINPGEHLYAVDFLNNNFGVVAGRYGEVLIFESNIPDAPVVSLGTPQIVAADSVVLTGVVNASGNEAEVYFEYGSTQSLGSSVQAIPFVVNGTVDTDVAALLPGLSDGVYFYRISAENDAGLVVSEIRQFYVGDLWVTNNLDFEDWNDYSYTVLDVWATAGNVTQANSYDNTIAAQLNGTVDDTLAAVILGNVEGDDFLGGVPVATAPDSIVGYFNYDLAAGTQGFILLVLKSNGVGVATRTFSYTGTSNNLFERLSFPVDYTGQEMVDTVIIGFANNNPFGGEISLSNTVIIDNVELISENSLLSLPNNGFENWTTEEASQPVNWQNPDLDEAPYLNETVFRTTDSQHGIYAIRLQNNVSAQRNASLSTGTSYYGGPGISVGGQHQTLNGFIKFDFQSVVDTVNISVQMFEAGQEVGWGQIRFYESITEYAPFELEINYNQSMSNPDSANVIVEMGSYENMGSSQLWLDNLSFDGVVAPYVPLSAAANLEIRDRNPVVYPNPTTGIVWLAEMDLIQNAQIDVFNMNGSLQRSVSVNGNRGGLVSLDLGGLGSGIYFVRIVSESDGSVYTQKVVLQH